MFSVCEVYCCICRQPMDWQKRYGRDTCTCSRACYDDFDWRRTLSILGKAYYPRPFASTEAKS